METENLQNQINELTRRIVSLNEELNRYNFPSRQVFVKFIEVSGGVRITPYGTLPTVCQIGELASQGGKLYHCSAANTWTAQT